MELDPLYCDVIVRRFEQFTNRKAERPERLSRVNTYVCIRQETYR